MLQESQNGTAHRATPVPRSTERATSPHRGEHDPDGFLGPEEFAELLDVSRPLFFKIKSAGQVFPAEYFGRLPRWWRPHYRLWILTGRPVGEEWERVKRTWTEKQLRSWG